VLPIPKSQSFDIANLRPISVIPNVGKIFEKALLQNIKSLLFTHYDKHQYGFRTGYSTHCALITLLDDIYKNCNNKLATVIMSVNMSKAFDNVDHQKL